MVMNFSKLIENILNKIPIFKWGVKWSLWPVHVVTACCGVEFAHTFAPVYDAERLGLLPMPSLRHCNLLVIEGTVTRKMAKYLQWIYKQMPNPKYVIAIGSCALSGGVFHDSYNVIPVDKVLPVDIYVPGCPPIVESILKSFISLDLPSRTSLCMSSMV